MTHQHDYIPPPFRTAVLVWLKIGLLSFGGPAGQIALMHRIVVEEKRWIPEVRFLHALNYCMLLPGPEAQQLATYVGWLLHGTRGGFVAGTLFVLPGAIVMLALSYIYVLFAGVPLLDAIFLGIKAAVLVIVIEAFLRIAKRILKNGVMVALAISAFAGIFVLNLPFPLIVLAAGAAGMLGLRAGDQRFDVLGNGSDDTGQAAGPVSSSQAPRTLMRSVIIAVFGLAIWFAPIAVAAIALGYEHVLVTEGVFFSKLAVVTFGGAYAVLAYMAQQAVEAYAWLSAGEMLDGLGLAESTPGPLIMVTQFVGFLGAYRQPGTLTPETAALLGSALTIWVTFVPCFLWIFLGAPYVERMRHNRYANAALSAITAAVVGVILNLSIWFSLHVLFGEVKTVGFSHFRVLLPTFNSIDLAATTIAIAAAIALLRFKLGVIWTLIGCSMLGIAASHL